MQIDKDTHTLHFLRFGIAVCGREGLPYRWPPGHDFIGFDKEPTPEEKRKLCVKCKVAKAKHG